MILYTERIVTAVVNNSDRIRGLDEKHEDMRISTCSRDVFCNMNNFWCSANKQSASQNYHYNTIVVYTLANV